jgi:Mrp family chromosome partitioning ATPase
MFGCSRSPGLADVATAGGETEALLKSTENPNLFLLPHGESKNRQGTVQQLTSVGESERLRERFDYIIIDGDSVLGSSQVSLLVRSFDGVLLAVACERTKWEVVQQVKDKIHQGGGQVLGVILNRRKYYIPKVFYGRK